MFEVDRDRKKADIFLKRTDYYVPCVTKMCQIPTMESKPTENPHE